MKILVFSDSHGSLHSMREYIRKLKPDAVVHLGDHYEDGLTMQEEFPNIRFHLLPGNCDHNRILLNTHDFLCYDVCGVRLYMTHGHKHNVKLGLNHLLYDAGKYEAAGVLFGHTHQPLCYQREDGLWVLNPGSARQLGGSAGLIETEGKNISACRLIGQADIANLG